MNKKLLIAVGAVIAILLVVAIAVLMRGEKEQKHTDIVSTVDNWVDPSTIKDREELEQVQRLWPEVFQKDPREPEKVKAEWKEFAERYPKNFYLPPAFRRPATEDEKKAHRKRLDTYTDVATRFARIGTKAKFAEPGKPIPASEETFTFEEQQTYFNYRIEELESRIQLLDFAMEKNGLDADQISRSKKERADWQKELDDMKQKASELKKEDAK